MFDWSHLTKMVINAVQAFAASKADRDILRKPEPSRWNMFYSAILKEDDQKHVYRGKRRVTDSHGTVVCEWSDPATAEFVASVPPDVVLTMIETIEAMAAIIAKYRNSGLLHDAHTAESVRIRVMEMQYKRVREIFGKEVEAAEAATLKHARTHGIEVSKKYDRMLKTKDTSKSYWRTADPYDIPASQPVTPRGVRHYKKQDRPAPVHKPRIRKRKK